MTPPQQGRVAFTAMERVHFGKPAALAAAEETDTIGAKRVFILASKTLAEKTPAVERIAAALGERHAGTWTHMPAHSPRDAVVDCAAAAHEAGADLLLTVGGGSVTDGAKVVSICLEHDVTDVDGLDAFRTIVKPDGKDVPRFAPPKVRQISIPTTLSAGEFNPRAGVTDTRTNVKQSYENRGIVPIAVILDPAVTVHTPQWLFLSSGIRAFDHCVESYLSIASNPWVDGQVLHAIRLLTSGLSRVKADPEDLEARQMCLFGCWLSMSGVVGGTPMGASHAIGHILGGTCGVPHGYTSCVMLPAVLRWNAEVNGERQKDIAAAMGRPGGQAADLVAGLIAGLGHPRRLSDVGVERDQFELVARNTMHDAWTYSNPRKIDRPEQIMEILELAA